MNPFFQSPQRQELLQALATRWLGTPFHAQARLPGVGVDCVHLLAEILQAAGVLADYAFPRYVLGCEHLDRSLVTTWLDRHPAFARLGLEAPRLPGDVLCIRWHRVAYPAERPPLDSLRL